MGRYDDIIDMPRHVSTKRAAMQRRARAAQFAPFAALTGYDDSIAEAARLTDKKLELSDMMIDSLNQNIAQIRERITKRPAACVTYFVADENKSGGRYETVAGNIRHIDDGARMIIMTGGLKIPIDDVYFIELPEG